MTPSIALVVVSHNREALIRETIASVMAQPALAAALSAAYLADDASSDGTVEAARSAWHGEPPLVVLAPDRNLGQWPNLNRALDLVGGEHEWLLILHDDDLVKPHWLEHLVDRIRACPLNVASICTSWDSLRSDASIAPGEDDPERTMTGVSGGVEAARDTLLRGCWWHLSGCALRTAAVRQVGSFEPALLAADWDWLIRCLLARWSIEYLPRTLLIYREHQETVSAESLATHRDIAEQLLLSKRYGTLLTKREALRFHGRRLTMLARRGAGAIVRARFRRAAGAAHLVPTVIASCTRALTA